MISKSGYPLLTPRAVSALLSDLIPLARVVTPNVPEAELLSGLKIRSPEDAEAAAAKIRAHGCRAVLVKGGHLRGGEASDFLQDGEKLAWLSAPRIRTRHTHGTGCTYSAAIATHLALGKRLAQAVRAAKDYVTEAIRNAPGIGHGQGPVHHTYLLEKDR
jgi:hydroxymethylpyrimidine/phosphomethylpyrimidine kinase